MSSIHSEVVYPESDGMPMAESTLQFSYIVLIKEGLEILYRNREDVFVAGDLFWYPVEGSPDIRVAPDAMVAFGRPKRAYLGSYRQWEEDDIAPQVVFEVLSPSNTPSEMERKLDFYDQYGVEEYYVYDPLGGTLEGYLRGEGGLTKIDKMQNHVSPRLGARFELRDRDLVLFRPDNQMFRSPVELEGLREHAEEIAREEQIKRESAEKDKAQAEKDKAQAEKDKAQAEKDKAQAEKDKAEAQALAKQAENRAEQAEQKAETLAARLRALGIDPDSLES